MTQTKSTSALVERRKRENRKVFTNRFHSFLSFFFHPYSFYITHDENLYHSFFFFDFLFFCFIRIVTFIFFSRLSRHSFDFLLEFSARFENLIAEIHSQISFIYYIFCARLFLFHLYSVDFMLTSRFVRVQVS